MSETCISCSPRQLRALLVIILTACAPSDPKSSWEEFKDHLSEDFLRDAQRVNNNSELPYSDTVYNRALVDLEDKCISMNNKTLQELGLFSPLREIDDAVNRDVLRETNYDADQLQSFVQTNRPLLVADQELAFSTIMRRIENNEGGLLFLDAPGGTGKTFLMNLILAEVRRTKNIAVAVASSGIAATLLDGGRTAHSALKLPFNLAATDTPICNISINSGRATILRQCKIIIWDECTRAHKKALEALDRTMQDLRKCNGAMGGALLLLGGDFRQTLPVIPKSTAADELNACLKASYLWRHVQKLTLSTNMRVHLGGDVAAQNFAQQLLEIGEGMFYSALPINDVVLSPNFCNLISSVDEVVNNIFPNIAKNFTNHEWLRERAILAPRNDNVNDLNIRIQNKLPGAETIYKSIDTVTNDEQVVNYPTEFLNSLEPAGLPPHMLILKIRSPIMLLRNLDPPTLCNGTRLLVKQLHPNVIEATILTGVARGEDIFIPRIPLIPSDMPFEFKRLQFPVRLAFSMTINKAQGQSLAVAGINLETPCFSHGQFYVACSRVGNPQHLYIYAPNNTTRNTVYPTALN